MKVTACIETIFTELPWEARFEAAKKAGFDLIEFWSWTDKDLPAIRQLAADAGIGISGFNGDADYSLIDPSHKQKYLDFLARSLDAAVTIGAQSVTIHSNGLGEGGVVLDPCDHLSFTTKLCSMYDMLLEVRKLAEDAGVTCNLEALNVTTDHQGNFLQTTAMAADLIRLVDSPRVRILYDAYHMQLNEEGSICDTLTAHLDTIGHVHIADAPGRHEPGTGEIAYRNVIRHLQRLDYQGAVGCELFPLTDSQTAAAAIMDLFR